MALGMPTRAWTFRTAILCLAALLPACAHAEGIDTEHLFGFMIGADVGSLGEREFQSETNGSFGKIGQEFELEFVPVSNFRVEIGSSFAGHDVRGVPGLDDVRQLAWQGVSLDLRYRLLNRDSAPFGLTFAVEGQLNRVDEISAARVRNFETEFRIAFDREVIPNYALVALNLIYQPEWTRVLATGAAEQEANIGAALGAMFRIRPDVLVGGEARYLRRYEGIALDEFSGHALFVGPTAYFQLSPRSRLTAAWSVQAWGRPAGSGAALDLVNFERHRARLIFGVNF
jgi:hypothetical protein